MDNTTGDGEKLEMENTALEVEKVVMTNIAGDLEPDLETKERNIS